MTKIDIAMNVFCLGVAVTLLVAGNLAGCAVWVLLGTLFNIDRNERKVQSRLTELDHRLQSLEAKRK
jgi:membrane protein DedA with SNARE-associated domain